MKAGWICIILGLVFWCLGWPAMLDAATGTINPRLGTAGSPDDSAAKAGIPPGKALERHTGTYYVTEDNAVVDGVEVVGNVVVEGHNVTIKNSRIISNTPWHAIRVMDGATGFTLMDSEIDGGGRTVNGVLGYGTFLRNDISRVDNGLNIWSGSVVRDNCIHDLGHTDGGHFDGIEINGGSNIQISRNTIINDNEQTSAIMLTNYFAGLANITIDDNRLVGGGYTIYLDDRSAGGDVDDASIRITNNRIGGGHWGDFALYDTHPVLRGNAGLDGESGCVGR